MFSFLRIGKPPEDNVTPESYRALKLQMEGWKHKAEMAEHSLKVVPEYVVGVAKRMECLEKEPWKRSDIQRDLYNICLPVLNPYKMWEVPVLMPLWNWMMFTGFTQQGDSSSTYKIKFVRGDFEVRVTGDVMLEYPKDKRSVKVQCGCVRTGVFYSSWDSFYQSDVEIAPAVLKFVQAVYSGNMQ